jgi:hypothetical protein
MQLTPGIFARENASSPVRKSSGYSNKNNPITTAYTKYRTLLS